MGRLSPAQWMVRGNIKGFDLCLTSYESRLVMGKTKESIQTESGAGLSPSYGYPILCMCISGQGEETWGRK